jgi:signal transduction histidine kinase
VLDDLGLVDALEWYTSEFERRSQIPCIFTHDAIPVIDDTLATAAYRIAQEALTNVARHADATKAEVTLDLSDGSLVLTVGDDGRGFKEDLVPESEDLGLAGMRERATLAGGVLAVVSHPGSGTQVCFKVRLSS